MGRARANSIWVKINGNKPYGYHIHHIDGDKDNNDIDNLICVSPRMHYEIHKSQWEETGNRQDYGAALMLYNAAFGPPPTPWNKGIPHNTNPEAWEKISKALGTECLDLETGIFYNSKRRAAEALNIHRSNIPNERIIEI